MKHFCANCTLPGVGIEYGVESDDEEEGSSGDVDKDDVDKDDVDEEGEDDDDGNDDGEDDDGNDDGDDDVDDDDSDDDGDDDDDDDGEYEDVGENDDKSRSVSVELSLDNSLVRSVVELGDASRQHSKNAGSQGMPNEKLLKEHP